MPHRLSNTFDDFALLPPQVQAEALREGEVLLNAQLTAATAADQRALTWAGFLIASATAALGGGIALLTKAPPDALLAVIALFFAGMSIAAAGVAIRTVTPKEFAFPGARPGLWLPDQQGLTGTAEERAQRDRVDRARQIDTFVRENMESAERSGMAMRWSFKMTFIAIVISAVALGATLTLRYFAPRKSNPEIIIGPTAPHGLAVCTMDSARRQLQCQRYVRPAS